MDINSFSMLLNFVSSLVLTISFTGFIIFVFGRQNSKINELPWYKTGLVKLGLCFCAAGALFSVLCYSLLPWHQTLLNAGLAMVFAWAAHFHYTEFVSKSKIQSKKNNTKKKKIKSKT